MYRKIILVLVIFLSWLIADQECSSQFYKRDGEIYDSWGICRTRAQGEDGYFQVMRAGFRPVIVLESLGKDDSLACKWGKEFLDRFPEDKYRAKKIFEFIKNKVGYIHDIDQFGYREFAQNADELAHSIQEGDARGDCEDYAILLTTLYKMAGYRSAVVLIPGHAAALVYLPSYKSGMSMKIGGKEGWIWAEATGRNNYLGWVPSKVLTSPIIAYEIKDTEEISLTLKPGGESVEPRKKGWEFTPFISFLVTIFIILIFPIIVRFLRASQKRIGN